MAAEKVSMYDNSIEGIYCLPWQNIVGKVHIPDYH